MLKWLSRVFGCYLRLASVGRPREYAVPKIRELLRVGYFRRVHVGVGHGRERGQFCLLAGSQVSSQWSRLDLSSKPVWTPASGPTAADRVFGLVGGVGST